MSLQLKLSQKLNQSLSMTPQLQHAIKLLQLGRLDYISAIGEELEKNPLLEEVREDFDTSDFEYRGGDKLEAMGESGMSDPSVAEAEPTLQSVDEKSPFAEEDYLEYLSDSQALTSQGGNQPDFSVNTELAAPLGESLSNFLNEQIEALDISTAIAGRVRTIIGNLDQYGYLECSLSELVQDDSQFAEFESALTLVQSLDPPGVGARNLRECLLLQLERLGRGTSVAFRIVADHLALLQTRRYQEIARSESVEVEEVYKAIREIQSLEPHPARAFVDDAAAYVIPDIYIIKEGSEFVVSLNDDGVPRLRISPYYLDLLRSQEGKSRESREYINERLKAATWLLKSIQQRQQSIFKVTESIVRFQKEFFEKGVQHLKPLVLKTVADDIGMHESTVSRVTSNKFVHTPQGVFELKFFFSSAIAAFEGELSSSAIREKIKQLISAEDDSVPLSDQQLVDALKKEGIDIARRTVAKYREALGFLSASKRKKLF
jgi:RNA polymerase sigma-54 factor